MKVKYMIIVPFLLFFLFGCDFLGLNEGDDGTPITPYNALAGQWTRTELIDEVGDDFGKYWYETYQFEADSMLQLSGICDDADCTTGVVPDPSSSQSVTYGGTVTSTEGLSVYEVDFENSEGGEFYTIIHVDSSVDPHVLTFGDSDADSDYDGSTALKRVQGLGSNPETFSRP
ncbi:MAG: hypothetical protein OCD02_09165 [Spirochaetaceae bacterium]